MQRAITVVVVLLVLFWIIDAPTSAAGTVHTIVYALGDAARQVTVFLRTLF